MSSATEDPTIDQAAPWPFPPDDEQLPGSGPDSPPPPPPAPPPTGRAATNGHVRPRVGQRVTDDEKVARQPMPQRRFVAALVIGCLALLVIAPKMIDRVLAPPTIQADLVPLVDYFNYAIGEIESRIPPVVVVNDPLGRYGCDLRGPAKSMIGGSAATGGKTLDPARMQQVADRVATLIGQQVPPNDIWLDSKDGKELRVEVRQGTPLFDCTKPYDPQLKQTEVPAGTGTSTTIAPATAAGR